MAAHALAFRLAFLTLLFTAVSIPARQPAAHGLIVGRVIDAASGTPIGGAVVTLTGPASSSSRATETRAPGYPRILTGADGYFVFRDLPGGSFSLSATKSGFLAGQLGQRRPGGSSQSLRLQQGQRIGDATIRMWKYAAISGTVIDEAGEPLVNVVIRAFRRTTEGGGRSFVLAGNASTDDRGAYRIGSLIPGEYVIAMAARALSTPIGTPDAFSSKSMPPPELRGAPAVPGTPNAIQVGDSLYMAMGSPVPIPQSSGRLLIYPTTYYPSASNSSRAALVTIGSGEERASIDLQLQPVPSVRVSGTVVRPDSDKPPMVLRLVPFGEAAVAVDQDVMMAMVDANGSFTFPAVPAGHYSVRMQPRATEWTDTQVAVGAADLEGIVITPNRGLRISGRVEFEGLRESPSAGQVHRFILAVQPTDGTSDISVRPSVEVEAGRFTTGEVPAGHYLVRILASPPGWMFKSASHDGRDLSETPVLVTSDVSGVVISFTDRWTGLSGLVHSAQGSADTGALVLVFPTDPEMWTSVPLSPRRFRSARVTSSGEYGISSIPPGDYYVVAIADEQAAEWQDPRFLETLGQVATLVTIGDGEHKTQDLRTQEVR